MRPDLLAPCGINCGFCMRYLATASGLADKTKSAKCTGCRPRNKTCAFFSHALANNAVVRQLRLSAEKANCNIAVAVVAIGKPSMNKQVPIGDI
jgi:hypothetical protein